MSRALLLASALLVACGPSADDIARNLQSQNPVVREDTAKIARNYGSDAVVQSLISSLADPSPVVRRNAVDSLAELEATAAGAPLLELLGRETDERVRRQVIDALGRLDVREAGPALIALLEADEANPPLNAIWALGRVGDAAALPVLTRLRESSDPYISWNAADALRELQP